MEWAAGGGGASVEPVSGSKRTERGRAILLLLVEKLVCLGDG